MERFGSAEIAAETADFFFSLVRTRDETKGCLVLSSASKSSKDRLRDEIARSIVLMSFVNWHPLEDEAVPKTAAALSCHGKFTAKTLPKLFFCAAIFAL